MKTRIRVTTSAAPAANAAAATKMGSARTEWRRAGRVPESRIRTDQCALKLPAGGFSTPGVPEGLARLLDRLRYMLLPTVVLSLLFMASFTRYTRSSMLEVVRQDYVRTARAKGLSETVVINKHALRNALIPLATVVALSIPALFAGAPLTETVFGWPGVGRLLVEATLGGDYAVAQGIIIFLSTLVIVFNLLADISYALLDPRIRYD